jgi:outer membrane protein assembly factor BamD (BamD/ComL family)
VRKETAAELFGRANRARQSGDTATAIALYQRLEREHPASSEAGVAEISLARALLDGSPKEARLATDRYLANEHHTDLREEALALRARASNKLGDREEERTSWQMLVSEYPDSIHVPRAKQRLSDLR